MASLAIVEAPNPHASARDRGRDTTLDSKGVPVFARPWIQLGKKQEREKWQYFILNRTEVAIVSELRDTENRVLQMIPKECQDAVRSKMDASNTRISSLISDYSKLVSNKTDMVPTNIALVSLPISLPEKETTGTITAITAPKTTMNGIPEKASPTTGPTAESVTTEAPAPATVPVPVPVPAATETSKTPTVDRTDSKAQAPATQAAPDQPRAPPAQPSFRYPFFRQPTERRQSLGRRITFSTPTTQ